MFLELKGNLLSSHLFRLEDFASASRAGILVLRIAGSHDDRCVSDHLVIIASETSPYDAAGNFYQELKREVVRVRYQINQTGEERIET